MKVLGVITARGGSKSIPRKNIKELSGKPLIAYTIEAAKESGVFERIILSTDDQEIADVATRYGCAVPFLRPAELAEDTTPTLPVLQHALSWLKEHEGYEPDAVMLLQPTAPLRQPFHIREAVGLFKDSRADSVVGVVEIPGHSSPYWAVIEGRDGWAELFIGQPIRERITRRQDFPQKVFAHSGAIYLLKTELLFAPEPSLYGERVKLYPMAERYCVNIDSPEDWVLAEYTIRQLESR